jgi:hypothetical protein
MNVSRFASRFVLAALCALPAAQALAQAPNGRWNCQVGGIDVELTIAGEQATLAFSNGERFTLKLDPSRMRPFYTDGNVALRMSGGGPDSTRSPEWVRNGAATTIERCNRMP